jgi:hypothetical protein
MLLNRNVISGIRCSFHSSSEERVASLDENETNAKVIDLFSFKGDL